MKIQKLFKKKLETKESRIVWIREGIYWLKLVTLLFFMIALITLLKHLLTVPTWQKTLFLLTSNVYIVGILLTMLTKRKTFYYMITYNLLSIGAHLYFLIVWGKLCLDQRIKLTFLYEIDTTYLNNNCLLLSILLIGILISTIILYQEKTIEEKFKDCKIFVK